jgi:hypothetical protein
MMSLIVSKMPSSPAWRVSSNALLNSVTRPVDVSTSTALMMASQGVVYRRRHISYCKQNATFWTLFCFRIILLIFISRTN